MIKKSYDEITDQELEALTSAIKNRYGIDFTNYERKSLKRGFTRLMRKNNIDSLLDLWRIILKDQQFFKNCIDDLTVNLTELFRNPEIWEAMEHVLMTLESKSQIKIWHAGCATGEEVYSMAMVAENSGFLHKIDSLGTDISSVALKRAQKGIYPKDLLTKYEKSLRKYLPSGNITDMFYLQNGNAEVKKNLSKVVEFRNHNLVSDSMNKKFDIVFCRNVLIYFDDVLKMKVLKKLLSTLNPDGFLVLGYYDMLPDESREILEQYDSNNRIYTPIKTEINQLSNPTAVC